MTIEKVKCKKCGYEWYPRTEEKPKVCSRCKSFDWDEEIKKEPYGPSSPKTLEIQGGELND